MNGPRGDSTRGSGLGTRGGRWALLSFCTLYVLHDLLIGNWQDHPWMLWCYLAGYLGALLVTTPGTAPLSKARSSLLVVCLVVASAAILSNGVITDSFYYFSYISFLLGMAAARDNPVAAGIGGVALLTFGAVYVQAQDGPPAAYNELLTLPLLGILVGYLIRWWFRRMIRAEQSFRSEAERAKLAALASEASITASRAEYASISRDAGPLLEHLARGDDVTAAQQRAFSVAEAQIRDRLVAPGMLSPPLMDAVRHHRNRGAVVVLLGHVQAAGDPMLLPEPVGERLVSDLTEVVDAIRITIRQHPPTSAIACTLLVETAIGRTLRRYGRDGQTVGQA
ncbi:hypothetical protein [Leucobacter tenebrionis]|uniref:hypothetical protein n=1 Tax=Leucobacter tenebrionis TaxID=2873270 RepID=UPI001CA74F87|nr:hypothetical protein [Leucobacter tenebrionis]QZY51517.1 hypothetical protein KVY00_13260 [Leucobacter tenebrionis]